MSKTENTFIVNILEELDKDSMEKFLNFLNVTGIDRNTIPKAKLEGASVMKVVELLVSYYHPRHLEVLRKALLDVPENQLADKTIVQELNCCCPKLSS
uniref:Pyrin domain-containing protein n=1 Tax=Anolis carolinensis TaxID=28377 RepID=A0A803TDV9_ANOCA